MALSWLNCHTWPIVYIFVVCLPIYCHAAPYSYNSSSHAFPGMPVQAPQAGLGRSVIIPDQMINVGDDVSRIFRRDSEDPSCPDGFLCVQQACPAEIICEAGESCFNFEGTIACGDPGLQWCAFNPSTLEAVGCNGGQCCHGNCYSSDAVCCDFPSIQCVVGSLCNACNPGQTCGNNQCVGSTTTTNPTSSPTPTTSTTISKPPSPTPVSSTTTSKPPSSSTTSTTTSKPPSSSTTSTTTSKPPSSTATSTTTSTSSTLVPTLVPSVGPYNNVGCFFDTTTARVLAANSSTNLTPGTGMTVEKCIAFAQQGAFKFAGVEFGGQCFVDNTMHNATAAPQNNCNQPCAGNPAEACGQSNRIQIYEDSLNPTSSPILTISTTTSTLTLKPTSSPLPTILTTMSTSTSKPISSPPPTASTTTLNPTSSHTSSPPPTTLTTTSNPTSSHTPTASTSSSSTSSTLIPTLVPFVGTFSNIGCFFDTTVARVLVANSSINLTPGTGMTVEECIGFAQQGGFQFGGVEFGGQCFVGNTIHNATAAPQNNCNQPCAGNPAEACGQSNRIQIYQDSTWFDPTVAQLVAALQEYSDVLTEISALVDAYQQDIQTLQSLQAQPDSKIRRQSTSATTIESIEMSILGAEDSIPAIEDALDEAKLNINALFSRAQSLDISRTTNPIIDSIQLEDLQNAVGSVSNLFLSVAGSIADDAASIAASTTPLLNLAGDASVVADAVGGIGALAVLESPATGVFLVIAGLLDFLLGTSSSSPQPPPPVMTPPPSTPSSTSSSTTCSPTMSPTPVVVLMSVDSTRDQYDNLVDGFLKSDTPVTDQIIFDTVNFRAFTAELDDCDVISLLDNPSVSTVSLDAIGNMETLAGDALLANTNSSSGSNPSVISRDVVDMTTRRHILNHTLLDRDIPEASQELEQQGAFFDGSAPVLNSPSHLGWLTATWAQIGLAGQDTYFAFEDYLFDADSLASSDTDVAVYILDTGAQTDHFDIEQSIQISYDATLRQDEAQGVTDLDGHGTCMASCVGGVYAGVNKVADIVPVKILPPSRAGPSLSDLVNAFGLIMMDLTSRGRVGVINMSFDFDLAALPVIPSQALNTMDPFRDIVNRFTGLAVLVVASGNDPTADLATATPQTNGGANTDMIVVGAASLNHLRAPFSTFLDSSKDDILTIYGPGVDVVAADLAPTFPFARYTTTSGSSHATAIVAAIISIYLTLGMTSINNAKAFLLQQAITLKGNNWPPDQGSLTHPRAGIAVQVTCTPTVSTDIPFATVPLTTTFNPDITIATPSVDTNFITDIDSDLLPSCVRISTAIPT